MITYSEEKKAEWDDFKRNGGEISLEIDGTDIDPNLNFEQIDSIKAKLKTGFEIAAPSFKDCPDLVAKIAVHGSAWDAMRCRVYLEGGKVVYKKKDNGKYEAICTVPA